MLCFCRFNSWQLCHRAQPVAGGRLGGSGSQQLRGQRMTICNRTTLWGDNKRADMLTIGQCPQETPRRRMLSSRQPMRCCGKACMAEQVTREGTQFDDVRPERSASLRTVPPKHDISGGCISSLLLAASMSFLHRCSSSAVVGRAAPEVWKTMAHHDEYWRGKARCERDCTVAASSITELHCDGP